MLRLGRSRAVKAKTLMMISSLFMTDAHRRTVLAECLVTSKEKRLVITHGTDTMPETAVLLGKR